MIEWLSLSIDTSVPAIIAFFASERLPSRRVCIKVQDSMIPPLPFSARSWLAFLLLAQAAPMLHAAPGAYAGAPYAGTPRDIPGTIQAVYYDVAPANQNGIAYNRKGTPRPGPVRATGDSIGIGHIDSSHVSVTGEKQTGGDYVGWTGVGDWWNYTVRVAADGTYDFGVKIAAGAKGAKISVTFTPLDPAGTAAASGPLEIPTTAGFQPGVEVYHVWETLPRLATVKLAKGLYVMTVKVEAVAGLNIETYTVAAAK
jgi:hypothetical protein